MSVSKSDTLHTTILNEMRTKGLFKKLSSAFTGYYLKKIKIFFRDFFLLPEEFNEKSRSKVSIKIYN